MKLIRKVRQLAKEDPLWLSIIIVAVSVVLTAINVTISILELKGIV